MWKKAKNSNCDNAWQVKLWQNSKNSNCDKSLNCYKTKKTQIVTKIKNSNCDKPQELKMWQNSQTQIMTKLKLWINSKCDKTQTLKLWQLKNSNCDVDKKKFKKLKMVTKL